MKTLSPILNGFILNPKDGVFIAHVKIPVDEDSTFSILTPLVLFVVNNLSHLIH